MRTSLVLILPVALAARTTQIQRKKAAELASPINKTVEWYQEKGLELSGVSNEHFVSETEEQNESHLFKIECLDCPFRRNGNWIAKDNSLLLNFTVVASGPTILLNGHPVWPLISSPPAISAFQIPSDRPTADYNAIVHALSRYDQAIDMNHGALELGYKHARLATKQPDLEYLQFDITSINSRRSGHMEIFDLNKEDQKMIEMLLHRGVKDNQETVEIRTIDAVQRAQKQEPLKMPCGRDAMLVTEYNPKEWDEFGRIGTWSHTWNQLQAESWFARNWLNIHFAVAAVAICVLIRRRWAQRGLQTAEMREQEDVEASLLSVEDGDAPPAYEQETMLPCPEYYDTVEEEQKEEEK